MEPYSGAEVEDCCFDEENHIFFKIMSSMRRLGNDFMYISSQIWKNHVHFGTKDSVLCV